MRQCFRRYSRLQTRRAAMSSPTSVGRYPAYENAKHLPLYRPCSCLGHGHAGFRRSWLFPRTPFGAAAALLARALSAPASRTPPRRQRLGGAGRHPGDRRSGGGRFFPIAPRAGAGTRTGHAGAEQLLALLRVGGPVLPLRPPLPGRLATGSGALAGCCRLAAAVIPSRDSRSGARLHTRSRRRRWRD